MVTYADVVIMPYRIWTFTYLTHTKILTNVQVVQQKCWLPYNLLCFLIRLFVSFLSEIMNKHP